MLFVHLHHAHTNILTIRKLLGSCETGGEKDTVGGRPLLVHINAMSNRSQGDSYGEELIPRLSDRDRTVGDKSSRTLIHAVPATSKSESEGFKRSVSRGGKRKV